MTNDLKVRAALQAYADRGVFRGFSDKKTRNGKAAFTFLWQTQRPLEFIADTNNGTLAFKNLLPDVPSGSAMHKDIKRFLDSLHDRGLPKHRRIDRARAEVVSINRGGNLSILLKVKNNQYKYGVNRLVNLAHEMFVHLNNYYADYLSETFGLSQE